MEFSAITKSLVKSTADTALRMPSLMLPEPIMRAFSTVWLSSITVRGAVDCAPSCADLPAPARRLVNCYILNIIDEFAGVVQLVDREIMCTTETVGNARNVHD